MDKDKNGIKDKIDAILRYLAGFILIGFVGFGIVAKSLDTSAIIVLSALGAVLVGEEKALSALDKWRGK